MHQLIPICLFLSAGLIASGCDIPSSERCGDGDEFYWNPETHKCKKQDTEQADTDTGTLDTGNLDAGTEDSGTDTNDSGTGDGILEGLGVPCKEQADCEGFDADQCNARPERPNGYCTIKDCEPGGCPGGYQCCDCSSAGLGSSCINDIEAPLAEQFKGCVCS